MIQERSRPRSRRRIDGTGLNRSALTDELAPLPDWSQLGRHILAEAMRRAMSRMDDRLTRGAGSIDSHAKELS